MVLILCDWNMLGSHCNHYFLRMLASIGKGHYDAALETGTRGSAFAIMI
jgi:hypothetical protein